MKSTRRLLSIILCLIMCLSLLPTSAFAVNTNTVIAQGIAGMGTTFKLYEGGRLVVSGYGYIWPMEQWSFDAGGTYWWPLDPWVGTRSETRELVIEEGVVGIGNEVFMNCANLTSVTIPSSLLYVGNSAFENDSTLKAISFPGNVTYIGKKAFKGCVNLTDVMFVSGLQNILDSAFEDCTKLASITFPANLLGIGERAFANCGSLKSITFLGNYDDSGVIGVAIAKDDTATTVNEGAFARVTADVFYPVDNNSWNYMLDPGNTYNDFGGRLSWKASAGMTHSEGWVLKNLEWNSSIGEYVGDWYYYVDGVMIISNWKSFGGKWFYFGADGKMVKGHVQIDGNYYYFGQGTGVDGYPEGARVSGLVQQFDSDGNPILDAGGNPVYYYYDDNGVWQPSYSGVDDNGLDYNTNGWQQSNDGKWFFIRNHAKVKGWLYWNGYWYYLDPTTGAMVTGWLTWKGKTYYLRPLGKAIADGIPDKEGSMIADGNYDIGGVIYTFDKDGAVIAGGTTELNPLGLVTGWKDESSVPSNPVWKFYKADGTMAVGWLKLNNNWYYFDKNGKMLTGWQKIGGVWYYLTKWAYSGSGDEDKSENWVEITDPTDTTSYPGFYAGRMATGFNKIPYTKGGVNTVRTYYFKNSGALNGRGWIKVNMKWYFLETDGVVVTGWFRDNTKWYFLDPGTNPIGEMVTGYVEKTADGSNMKDPGGTVGGQSFAASGEWLGAGALVTASKAGKWVKHGDYWYYYNAEGDDYNNGNNNAVTGWQLINGKWYYLSPSGSTDPKNPPLVGYMLTGWQDIDGERYFFDPVNGDAKGGWQKIDGVWYYMYPVHDGGYGKMLTGWHFLNGKWYYLYDDPASSNYGALQDGWIKKPANDNDSTEYWFYLEEDQNSKTYGAMQEGGWKKIRDKWYYFHDEHDGYYGKLEQGEWINTKGKWYFVKPAVPDHPEESMMVTGVYEVKSPAKWPGTYDFGTDGACKTPPTVKTGWNNNGGNWTYVNSDGTLATGAKTIAGKEYYFDSNGIMQTGVQKVGGKLYYYDSDGAKVKKTGLQTIDGNTYYFNTGYDLETGGPTNIDGKYYYFDENTAAMQKGLQTIGSDKYYFDTSTGAMQTGWQTSNGNKYYFDPSTGKAKTGQQTIGGNDYYFDDDGVMQTGIQDIGSDTYFFDDNGVMQKASWQTIDGNTYRFNGEGKMIKGTTAHIDGKDYTFDENGVLQGEI